MESSNLSRQQILVQEVLNAVTHGLASAFSIAGLVILLVHGARDGSARHVVAYAIYGSSMLLLFLFSTLFHSLIFTKAKTVFQVFDHAAIYLLIAGSYTPFCLLSIRGWLGWTLFVAIWLFALSGIVYKSLTLHQKETVSKVSTVLYLIMGWLCLVAVRPLTASLGFNGTLLLVSGGLSYSIGAIFYSLKNVRYMHVVWHLFVMLGAAFIYFAVLFYT